jgi:cyclopropane fatty-acyl-phospholipid synthase-like methyltransferase
MKPYAESCDQNRDPILAILREEFAACQSILEIGSGTGQHAVYFARRLSHLDWQTSDCREYHAGILAWLAEEGLPNLRPPLPLDVSRDPWPTQEYDGIFSANTVHIMGWDAVQDLFAGIGRVLAPQGRFCLYGPFNYQGRFTSESNARFDQWLKARDPRSGVRNFEDLDRLASAAGMSLLRDHAMPANNRTLVWAKQD